MDKSKIKKIVLAYSGGLDTSVIIPWLKEHYNDPEIIAVAADVGQGDELDGLEEKAIKTGASKLIIADLTDEMCDDIIVPSVMMDAKYEKYLLGTAFARPVIGKKLAEIALAEGADAIAHGATGKGNDQVRFELAIKRFAPDMAIIAPWREWEIKSRDEEIDYAEAHHVPLKISRETNYSKDKNLWHLSHEGLDLEDPANEPDLDKALFLEMGVSPYQAPDTPTTVSVSFEAGVPVAVDGEKMKVSDIIRKLNKLGGENGIGLAVFSPLSQGFLTDRYLHGIPKDSRIGKGNTWLGDQLSEELVVKLNCLNDIASKRGQTLSEMALAWCLSNKAVTTVLVGASSPEQIRINTACLKHLDFSEDELAEIRALL